VILPRFIGLTPAIELIIRNPFTGRAYPERGSVVAIIDTGYEGFLLIPSDVFDTTFGELESERRELILADGRKVRSRGVFGETILEPYVVDGFIETVEGVNEFVVGAEFLESFKLELDYCAKTARLALCPQHLLY
jgi:clan AA aspartic protease